MDIPVAGFESGMYQVKVIGKDFGNQEVARHELRLRTMTIRKATLGWLSFVQTLEWGSPQGMLRTSNPRSLSSNLL